MKKLKTLFNALTMCFSMFCAIPSPFRKWDEEAQKYMLLFLPLVGAFIGGLWYGAAYLLNLYEIPKPVTAMILTALPFLLTGGIHFDGFLDVTDALKSCKSLEERVKILKDPHVGSFAVLYGILLILAEFALFAGMKENPRLLSLLFIPVISRTVAAVCVSVMKPLPTSQYSNSNVSEPSKQNTSKTTENSRKEMDNTGLYVWFLLLVLWNWIRLLNGIPVVLLTVVTGYLVPLLLAKKVFKGISGDISGFAMTIAELCGIAAFVLL